MADIFDEVLAERQNSSEEDIFDQVLSERQTQGGEQTNEQNQSQAYSDRNAGRESNQQIQSSNEVGIQANGEPSSLYLGNQRQATRQVTDIFDQVLSERKGGELVERQQKDAVYGVQGKEEGKGLRGEVPSGNKEEVESVGVQPPDQGFFEQAKGATIAAGASAAETRAGLKAGEFAAKQTGKFIAKSLAGRVMGTVAAAAAVPLDVAEASTGIGALAIPATEMAAFAAGSYLGDKATELVEKIIGVDDTIEKAKEENPMISEIASLATMAPMAIGSIKNLAGMTAKQRASKIGGGAIGGAAFEPIRYGVESILKEVTGSDKEVAPITFGSEAQSIAMGAVLSAHGAKEIAKKVGPNTSKAALNTPTEKYAESVEKEKPTPTTKEEEDVSPLAKVEAAPSLPKFEDPNGRAEALYRRAEEIAQQGDTEATEEAIRVAENSHAFEEVEQSDLLDAQRLARVDAIRESVKSPEADKPIVPAEEVAPKQEKGNRIGAAAWMNPRTGAIFHGANHEEALDSARLAAQDPANKDMVAAGDLPKVDTTKPENRETSDFGFLTTDGKFVSRQKGEQIGSDAGQLRGDKARDLLHSHEIEMDWHKGKAQEGEVRTLPEEPKVFNFGPGASAGGELKAEQILNAAKQIRDGQLKSEDYESWKSQFEEGEYTEDQLKSIFNNGLKAERDSRLTGKPIEKAAEQMFRPAQVGEDVSIKISRMNELLKGAGLPELPQGKGTKVVDLFAKAADKINQDKTYQYNLIEDLKKNPRHLSADESAVLTFSLVDAHGDYENLLTRSANEKDPSERAKLDQQIESKKKEIAKLAEISAFAGTAWSDAGRVRNAVLASDYSLPNLVKQTLRDKGKTQLSEEEVKELTDWHEKFTKNQKDLKGKEAEDKAQLTNTRLNGEIDSAKKNTKKPNDISIDERINAHVSDIIKGKDDPTKIGSSIRAIFKAVVEKKLNEGVPSEGADRPAFREAVAKETHDLVSKHIDGWSEENTRNAISGYGAYKKLNETAIQRVQREVRGAILQTAKLADAINNILPKVQERPKPGADERDLFKKVKAEVKKRNLQPVDVEGAMKTSLETAKTREKNAIEELDLRIRQSEEAGKRVERDKGIKFVPDQELLNLKKQREQRMAEFDATWPKPEATYEQKVAAAEKVYERNIADLKNKIASGEVLRQADPKEQLQSDRLDAQRSELESLQAERAALRHSDYAYRNQMEQKKIARRMRDIQDQLAKQKITEKKGARQEVPTEETANLLKEYDGLKKQMKDSDWYTAQKNIAAFNQEYARLANVNAKLRKQVAEGDFEPKFRKPPLEDEVTRQLRLDGEVLKQQREDMRRKHRLENRTPMEKLIDNAVGWKRFSVLGHIGTLGKLVSFGAESLAARPLEAAASSVLRRIPAISKIAEKDPMSQSIGVKEEINAIWDGLTKGRKEFVNTLKGNKAEIDLKYGDKKIEQDAGWMAWPGYLHAAIKNPIKQAAFESGYKKALQSMANRDMDIHDPAVQHAAGVAAYEMMAKPAIMMENNAVTQFYNAMVSQARASKSPVVRSFGYAAQELLPITKIPNNYIKQALDYSLGLVTGGLKVAKALHEGIDKLEPHDANIIMRQMARGSIGGIMLALGVIFPDAFGGYHIRGVQKDDDNPDDGGLKIFGKKVPKFFLHHPIFVPAQIGATIKKWWDMSVDSDSSLLDKSDAVRKGLAYASVGLLEESPFFPVHNSIGKLVDPDRHGSFTGEIVAGNIPGFIQDFAKYTDRDEEGNMIKRKREGLIDELANATPFWRKTLEEK